MPMVPMSSNHTANAAFLLSNGFYNSITRDLKYKP